MKKPFHNAYLYQCQITKKYNTVGTDPKVNRKIVERIEIDTTNTPIYDR
jgi:hypothetical protein